jgi:hypothetical protein
MIRRTWYNNECYSAIQRESLSFRRKWMELETIILREINQILHVFFHMQNLDFKKDMKAEGGLLEAVIGPAGGRRGTRKGDGG